MPKIRTYEQMVALADPSLRILFYADDSEFETGKYRLSRLQAALERASMRVDVVSRESGVMIDRQLLARYDEVWFFLRSHDGRELQADECEALRAWMDAGNGVLITGDHAELFGGVPVGLGAPVGRLVPRAGNLRAWGSGPGPDRGHSVDTIEISGEAGVAGDPQQDGAPQRLILPMQANLKRHPIFQGSDGRLLDRFPDHMHEGAVRIAPLDWAGEPLPVVVARGLDHWRAQCFDLMVAWDGHESPGGPKGRILADSSWHHYVDFNVAAIAEQGGDTWDKIQELYVNQAIWLAPPRVQLARYGAAMRRVAAALARESTADPRALGVQAIRELARELPGVLFAELLPTLSDGTIVSSEGIGLPGIDLHLVSAYMRRYQRAQLGAPPAATTTVLAEAVSSYRSELERLRGRWEEFARTAAPTEAVA